MDRKNLNALKIMESLPQVGRKHGIYGLTYGLTWSRGMVGGVSYQPDDPVGLTVLGHHQAGATDITEIFLGVLTMGCLKLTTFEPDPKRVVKLELTSDEVFAALGGDNDHPLALSPPELYELLEHEPAMWTGGRSQNQDGTWRWDISRSIRPYASVRTMEDYVEVISQAAEESSRQIADMVPLAIPAPYLGADPMEQFHPTFVEPSSTPVETPHFAPQVPLLGSAVDSELWEFVRPLVEAGRWEQVARESAAFVETRARDWTGSKRDILDLMSELLAPSKQSGPPDRDTTLLHNEQTGWHLLARGFFQAIRNHVMHNSVGTEEELQYGLGALGTASLLVRRIREAATSAPAADDGTL
ncbi:MAG: TIGR02391 family protein [Acidimicrobiales bacterium]